MGWFRPRRSVRRKAQFALPLQSGKLFFSGSASPGDGSIRNTRVTSSRATSTRLTSARMRSRLRVQSASANPCWTLAAKSSRRPRISRNAACLAASSASCCRGASRRAIRWRARVILGSNACVAMSPSAYRSLQRATPCRSFAICSSLVARGGRLVPVSGCKRRR
jgi:hypothetical protein